MTHRILILRLSALGDILHGLPVASALRRAFPDAYLGWLVEDRGAELLRGNPLLDRLHELPRRLMKEDLKRRPVGTLSGPLREFVREATRAARRSTCRD
jgi:ADP-heptose:LPS heptosyltransferase